MGLGAFGAVFSGIYLDSAVAVKIMKMQQPNDPGVENAFREEIEKLMYVIVIFMFFLSLCYFLCLLIYFEFLGKGPQNIL